jgi:hypothetical protein
MSEPQTQTTGDILPKKTSVSSGDNIADEDEFEENLERELLGETHEPTSADMYLLLLFCKRCTPICGVLNLVLIE